MQGGRGDRLTFFDDLTDKDLGNTGYDHGNVLRNGLREDVVDQSSNAGLVQSSST